MCVFLGQYVRHHKTNYSSTPPPPCAAPRRGREAARRSSCCVVRGRGMYRCAYVRAPVPREPRFVYYVWAILKGGAPFVRVSPAAKADQAEKFWGFCMHANKKYGVGRCDVSGRKVERRARHTTHLGGRSPLSHFQTQISIALKLIRTTASRAAAPLAERRRAPRTLRTRRSPARGPAGRRR